MKRFSEMDKPKLGLIGVVTTVLLIAGALDLGNLVAAIQGGKYSAQFAEAGGIQPGDTVRISGVGVGEVRSVDLEGTHVEVVFTANGVDLGDQTSAAIKTESALGTKFLGLTPRGEGKLSPGAEIPLSRTVAPYDITEAVGDLTRNTERIDVGRLSQSFDALSTTFANTPKDVQAALSGVRRLSETVASRDAALRGVLAHADSVTGVLAERNQEIVGILTDGSALLDEIRIRRETIRQLLIGVRGLTTQLSGLVTDNDQTLRPALAELRRSLVVLNKHADSLGKAMKNVAGFSRSLMEALGGGPFFYGYTANIAPTTFGPQLATLFGTQAGGR
jgi:phospholipid/cholesterol/gamma-HCH transport system substrate-binding protein